MRNNIITVNHNQNYQVKTNLTIRQKLEWHQKRSYHAIYYTSCIMTLVDLNFLFRNMPNWNQISSRHTTLNISYTWITINVDHNVSKSLQAQDCILLRSHHKYFEKELRKLPVEKLWEIMTELLLPYHDVPDKAGMNYEQVLELCVILKEGDEMFRNLEQIAILQSGLDGL